jgi:PAS domain S-box-containing protein
VQWNSSPILDREGNLRGHQAIGRDITEQRELRRQLEQERNKWWSLFHQATIGIIFSDRRHRVVEANPFAARILGYSVEELRGLRAQDLLHPEDFAAYTPEHSIAALREHGGPTQIERRYRRKDGSYMLVLVNVAELHGVEDDVFFLIMFHDITERKEAEEELRRAAQEKEHLMRELNHRVKNNLLMVSSLVSLKDAALGSAVDLSDVSNQIRAIQIVHQKLQKAADITEIELRDYVHELLEGVFASFAQKRVHIDNRLPEMTVGTRLAVPLGLIINELATNAIKHGFTGAEEPLFSVEMAHDPETGRWVLTASNTGAPFPPSVDIDAPQTLGLQLLTALVSQLHASLDVQREPHPLFTIRIPESVV